jgi:hypothetical protein
MNHTGSRRGFLEMAGLAGVRWDGLAGLAAGGMKEAVRGEVRRRAGAYSKERRLVVDYYRIRRKLAYELPVRSLSIPGVGVPSIDDYPWTIWMLWTLEERVNALGWAAEWFGDEECARLAGADLEALAAWPKYCQYDRPDLSSAHAGRLLWIGGTKWRWVKPELKEKLRQACGRHVAEVRPKVERQYAGLERVEDILKLPAPEVKLANIPLIGTAAAGLTAAVVGDAALEMLRRKLGAVMGAVLELRGRGFTEGVGYDGYILDFVADWLEAMPAAGRAVILEHPRFGGMLEESYMLSAPGAMEEVAELSDVEPREMPFHMSAQAKLAGLERNGVRSWYLRRCRLGWLPAAALGALAKMGEVEGEAPRAGAMNAQYACVLRTGWERGDVAVAMSANTSPMAHMQNDNGTLVIGTEGSWLIADPGYQQYMADAEREFTLGAGAHNAPVVNGRAQVKKESRLTMMEGQTGGLLRAQLEMGACYPQEAGVRRLVRNVWVAGRDVVVVGDEVEGSGVERLGYSWHGHKDAAWWCEGGWTLVQLGKTDLWFTAPQARLEQAQIVRQPGSRGQLTLAAEMKGLSVVWWVFGIGGRPEVKVGEGGRWLEVRGVRFEV